MDSWWFPSSGLVLRLHWHHLRRGRRHVGLSHITHVIWLLPRLCPWGATTSKQMSFSTINKDLTITGQIMDISIVSPTTDFLRSAFTVEIEPDDMCLGSVS